MPKKAGGLPPTATAPEEGIPKASAGSIEAAFLHEVSCAPVPVSGHGLLFTATGHPVHGHHGKPTAIIGPAHSGSRRRFRVCKLTSFADGSGVEELRVGVVENSTYAGLPAGRSWHSKDGLTANCAFFLCCKSAGSSLRAGGGQVGKSQTRTVREGGVITVQRVGAAVRFWLSEQCNEAPVSDSNPEGYLELEMQLPPGLADPDLEFAVQFHNHADAVMVEPELLLEVSCKPVSASDVPTTGPRETLHAWTCWRAAVATMGSWSYA